MSRAAGCARPRRLDATTCARPCRIFALCALLLVTTSCAATATAGRPPTTPPVVKNEDRLRAALRGVPSPSPLALRYNPAHCECPAFEARVGDAWHRADLTGGGEALAERFRLLALRPVTEHPIAVDVVGSLERDPYRTAVGLLAVRVEVLEITTPAPIEAPPAAPNDATAPAEGANP